MIQGGPAREVKPVRKMAVCGSATPWHCSKLRTEQRRKAFA